MDKQLTDWIVFALVVAVALAADLLVSRRSHGRITLKRALVETAAWVSVATLFGVWIYFWRGHQAGEEYFTAYLNEKSLS